MKHLRLIIGLGVAGAVVGCGGSQPPIGAPDAMPQSRAVAAHADSAGSWMLPEAKSEALLYAADFPLFSIHVLWNHLQRQHERDRDSTVRLYWAARWLVPHWNTDGRKRRSIRSYRLWRSC